MLGGSFACVLRVTLMGELGVEEENFITGEKAEIFGCVVKYLCGI